MIDLPEFQQTFMLTITVIMVLVAFGAGCVALYWLWQKGMPIRNSFRRYELPHLSIRSHIAHIKSGAWGGLLRARDSLLAILLSPLSFFLKKWGRLSEDTKLLTALVLFLTTLFGLFYIFQGVPLSKILGIVVAGALTGVAVSPFVGFYCWRFQKIRPRLALTYSFSAILWSALGAYVFVGFLIVLVS